MKNAICLLLLLSLISGCQPARKKYNNPANSIVSPELPIISKTYFDAKDDDLLTAGLGIRGLQATPPTFDNPELPSRAELRRNSIHYNINALLNTSANGGFGHLFGPETGQDKFAGYEYLSLVRDNDDNIVATLLVQVPDNFQLKRPCIIAGPSSGSRGIYGAAGIVGPWALRNGCAIAYTDKGTGTGFYYLDHDKSYNAWGELAQHKNVDSLFVPNSNAALSAYKENSPHRIAIKHAHSERNIEKHWPHFVLQAIRFAFQVLNTHYEQAQTFTSDNTIVIASGTSNGGNSSIRAAEHDRADLIDAVVVSEPNLNMPDNNTIRLIANDTEVKTHSRKLLDYTTHVSLYLPCALLADGLSSLPFYAQVIPFYRPLQENRCASLHKEGLLTAGEPDRQAIEALQKLDDYGILPDSHTIDVSFMAGRVWEGLSAVYTKAYGRYSVSDHVCNVSFTTFDEQGNPSPINPTLARGMVGISSGFIGSGGISISVDSEQTGREIFQSLNNTQQADMGLDTALCWRKMLSSERVQQGLKEIAVSGDLQGKPTIIVHGRHDSLIHVNHSSRPYYGLNKKNEAQRSKLHYYEIEHAQHFDKMLSFPNVAPYYVPLQHYLEQGLDLMLAHLLKDNPLPPSQVVRTDPSKFTGESLPVIQKSPHRNSISYKDNVVNIP